MHLTENTARNIINLNPYPKKGIIDPTIAERQFQVILKGFNYLLQPENNVLYIGDEVGLGKTYIATGIASLLRLYAKNYDTYIDAILVPKENLQYKWLKEIRNFISNNYLQDDNIVKSILKQPVAELNKNSIKKSICLFSNEHPRYLIFRNSSFSIASENIDKDTGVWIEKLKQKLPKCHQDLFSDIAKKFRRKQPLIKRGFAYLFNDSIPEIDLLIVDEAHNFKHGTIGDISIRNQIISRIFGSVKNDPELFEHFPQLKRTSTPKVKKLLLLSATPINNSLIEIKKQIDCFLPKHLFSKLKDTQDIEGQINDSLNQFLIRGVMTIELNNQEYSRNGYRHEHRNGNVIKQENAECQVLKDDSTSLFLSLMQYKTIKELKYKNGNQFEMGMLAGFESFHKNTSDYENDTLTNKKEREAKDENILKNIIHSYYETFKDYPPHPKQESLVEEVFNAMMKREKSLIFVRRIASVREIERKLFKKYSNFLIEKIKKVSKKNRPSSIEILLRNYEDEAIREGIESTLDTIKDRITQQLKTHYKQYDINDLDQIVSSDLREIYYTLIENQDIDIFKEKVKANVKLKYIKKDLQELAQELILSKWNNNLQLKDEDEDGEMNTIDEERFDEEKAPYFFQTFFANEGTKFKNKSYRNDWYKFNLSTLNQSFNLAITHKPQNKNSNFSLGNKTQTFITEFLVNGCNEEFLEWVELYKPYIASSSESYFLEKLDILIILIKSIFQQGSGLVPAFVADAISSKKANSSFSIELNKLLSGEFAFVKDEIKQIIIDYEKLVERNFDTNKDISRNLLQQLPVTGVSGHHKRSVRKTAIQFRMPGYPYTLITTDILKEGEDLHSYCKNIYHYGIAWNPSDMEQRTGRIDRIDSLAYRSLKELEDQKLSNIPFNNKLQVFYPYLADTLEVNQMRKLFNGMDNFIEIFYNDLSTKINRDSKTNINEVILDLPAQRKGLLKSKYDYHSFIPEYNEIPLKSINNKGITFVDLRKKMESINSKLSQFIYFENPIFDQSQLKISGTLNVDNRYGPFNLYFKQKQEPGQYFYKIESLLGRIQIVGKASNKETINKIINNKSITYKLNFSLKSSNSDVFITLKIDINVEPQHLINHLKTLVYLTDEIEKDVLGTDEKHVE